MRRIEDVYPVLIACSGSNNGGCPRSSDSAAAGRSNKCSNSTSTSGRSSGRSNKAAIEAGPTTGVARAAAAHAGGAITAAAAVLDLNRTEEAAGKAIGEHSRGITRLQAVSVVAIAIDSATDAAASG